MSSFRSIVSSPGFLALWAAAGIPAAAMMCHDVALAATTGAAIPSVNMLLAVLAQSAALVALRLLGAATGGAATGTSLGPASGTRPGG
jgi:hypothetical protein